MKVDYSGTNKCLAKGILNTNLLCPIPVNQVTLRANRSVSDKKDVFLIIIVPCYYRPATCKCNTSVNSFGVNSTPMVAKGNPIEIIARFTNKRNVVE